MCKDLVRRGGWRDERSSLVCVHGKTVYVLVGRRIRNERVCVCVCLSDRHKGGGGVHSSMCLPACVHSSVPVREDSASV